MCAVKLLSLFVCSSVRGLVAVTVVCHKVLSAIIYCNPRIVALLVSQSVSPFLVGLAGLQFIWSVLLPRSEYQDTRHVADAWIMRFSCFWSFLPALCGFFFSRPQSLKFETFCLCYSGANRVEYCQISMWYKSAIYNCIFYRHIYDRVHRFSLYLPVPLHSIYR